MLETVLPFSLFQRLGISSGNISEFRPVTRIFAGGGGGGGGAFERRRRDPVGGSGGIPPRKF